MLRKTPCESRGFKRCLQKNAQFFRSAVLQAYPSKELPRTFLVAHTVIRKEAHNFPFGNQRSWHFALNGSFFIHHTCRSQLRPPAVTWNHTSRRVLYNSAELACKLRLVLVGLLPIRNVPRRRRPCCETSCHPNVQRRTAFTGGLA